MEKNTQTLEQVIIKFAGDSGDGMQLQPLAHPGRVPLLSHGLWLVHRGGAELRVYAHASGSPHGSDIPPESACWLLPEERE